MPAPKKKKPSPTKRSINVVSIVGMRHDAANMLLKYVPRVAEPNEEQQWIIDQMLRRFLGEGNYEQFVDQYTEQSGQAWEVGQEPPEKS
jgi:hypothetical protein